MRPDVSVVMPVYNGAFYLQRSADSVIAQSQPNIELLIIDDGSKDKTREIATKIQADSQRQDLEIRYLRQPHQGVSCARNVGIQEASGRYIAFLDHDDALPPNSLEHRVIYLDANPDIQAVFAQLAYYGQKGEFQCVRGFVPGKHVQTRFLFGITPPAYFASCMVDAQALRTNSIYFDPELQKIEDQDFSLKLVKNLNFGFIKEVVYHYHLDSHGLSTRVQKRLSSFRENIQFVWNNSEGLIAPAAVVHRIAVQLAKLSWELVTSRKQIGFSQPQATRQDENY